MLFNIISWVCIILVLLYVIGLIVVVIIDKKSFLEMTSPLWLPIYIVFYLIYSTLKAVFKLFKKHQKSDKKEEIK